MPSCATSPAGKIYVYAFTKDGDSYQELGSVEGPGTAIGAMDFIRIKDGDQRLFTLTWTLASGVGKGLTVYSIQDGKLQELLDTTCTDYTIADLDQDGTEELFTLSYEGAGRKIAQVYSYADKQMSLLSQAYASPGRPDRRQFAGRTAESGRHTGGLCRQQNRK